MKSNLLLSIALIGVSACGESAPQDTGPHMTIAVAPLKLDGVLGARYTLEVFNNDNDKVWDKTVTSGDYGDGKGSLSYVGPCDASSNPNRVVLRLEALFGKDGNPNTPLDVDSFVNPTPVERSIVCRENADTRVDFDLVIARDASQGFFDIAVNFEDIFCSAKLDCVDKDGAPLELLHDGNDRSTTVVLGFACTTGENSPTWLHMSEIAVTCGGVRHALKPGALPGNQGGDGEQIFQWASYRGDEQLEPYDKCFWNNAIGLDLAAIGGDDCTLSATATATTGALTNGETDSNTTYPYIEWNVPLVTDGVLTCKSHPLNGVAPAGLGVTTEYTKTGPERFAYSMSCADAPDIQTNVAGAIACSGNVSGVPGVVFTPTAGGLTLSAPGSQPVSYTLPGNYTLTGCCADDCCTD